MVGWQYNRRKGNEMSINRLPDAETVDGVDTFRQAHLRFGTMFKTMIVETPIVEATPGICSRRCTICGHLQVASWGCGPLGEIVHECVRDGGAELIVWAEA